MSYRTKIISSLDPLSFEPTWVQPIKVKLRTISGGTSVSSHSHPWVQVVFSTTGIARVLTNDMVLVIPPNKAVWIPSSTEHSATVLQTASLYAIYLHESLMSRLLESGGVKHKWASCHVFDTSLLFKELINSLERSEAHSDMMRYNNLCALVMSELDSARPVPIGIALAKDRRLRLFCEKIIETPSCNTNLNQLAKESGASISTIHRLFIRELGMSFIQWRHQVILANSLELFSQGLTVSQIASLLGYSNTSAFSYMVRHVVGLSPIKFFNSINF